MKVLPGSLKCNAAAEQNTYSQSRTSRSTVGTRLSLQGHKGATRQQEQAGTRLCLLGSRRIDSHLGSSTTRLSLTSIQASVTLKKESSTEKESQIKMHVCKK